MNFLHRIKAWFVSHKVLGLVGIVVLAGLAYYVFGSKSSVPTRYVESKVSKGTIISAVTGSGQVSASNQIDIKPKVSGNITYLPVKAGQYVSAGSVIAQIDSTDALRAVRDAQANVASAELSLEKLKLQDSSDNMNASLSKSYDDGFNAVSNTFLDLPGIMDGLSNMFFKLNAITNKYNVNWYAEQFPADDPDAFTVLTYKSDFVNAYNTALASYNSTSDEYKSISRTSDSSSIYDLITNTYDTTKLIATAIKDANNYLDFVSSSLQKRNANVPAVLTNNKTTLTSDTSQTNTHLSDLLSIKSTIHGYQDAFPSNTLDLKSAELSVTQKQNALQDAKTNLDDYSIRAPFAGILAKVGINMADSVSSGTVVATIITKKQLANISLNEVDVSKIKIGEKATLTFDAIPSLSIVGEVESIDSIGTVTQGVVTYNVQIGFASQDASVKPGMSVSASIITDVHQDVLVVPNSAVKSSKSGAYVEMFDTPLPPPVAGVTGSPSSVLPRQQAVTTGISNDTMTEIVSGLTEGDLVVSRTITTTTTSSASTAPSLLGTGRGSVGGSALRTASGR